MLHCRLPGPDVPPTRTWECMLYEFYEWNHAMLAPMRAVADATRLILKIRRSAILGIVLLGYLYYRIAGGGSALASIGLLSFAAIAQFAPAVFLGLLWKQANARGAKAGLLAGIGAWAYTLLLPAVLPGSSLVASGPLATVMPDASARMSAPAEA